LPDARKQAPVDLDDQLGDLRGELLLDVATSALVNVLRSVSVSFTVPPFPEPVRGSSHAVPQHRGYEIGYRRRPEDMIAQIMRRLPGVAVALGFGISGCGGSARSTQTTAGSSPAETSMAAANYQGPLQNFQLADPANGPRVAADIAMVMENNLSASYPPAQGDFIFASCQKRGLPNELQCPWKVQNADQVEQVGDYAAAILATGIVYVYANNRGIYDVEVPAGGDASPVGATLPARTVSRPPPTATTPVPSSQATTRPQSTEQSIPHPAPSSPSTPPGAGDDLDGKHMRTDHNKDRTAIDGCPGRTGYVDRRQDLRQLPGSRTGVDDISQRRWCAAHRPVRGRHVHHRRWLAVRRAEDADSGLLPGSHVNWGIRTGRLVPVSPAVPQPVRVVQVQPPRTPYRHLK
jgi:hypothetical protein